MDHVELEPRVGDGLGAGRGGELESLGEDHLESGPNSRSMYVSFRGGSGLIFETTDAQAAPRMNPARRLIQVMRK
jgi:hypothetical protein